MSLTDRQRRSVKAATNEQNWSGVDLDKRNQKLAVCEYEDHSLVSEDYLPAVVAWRRDSQAIAPPLIFGDLFATAFRAAPAALMLSEFDSGRFVEASDGLLRFLQYGREELTTKKVSEVLFWANSADEERLRSVLREKRSMCDMSTALRTKQGAICPVLVSAELINCTGLLYMLAVIQSVAPDGLPIREGRDLKTQLWRSQKLEAIGRLAGGIAHDFNNLLTVITGYSDLVLASLGGADPRRKNVEEILKAGERAASLTRQLLAFSRRQVLAPQPLDLNSVILNLDKMLRRLIGEDIEVLNVLAPDLWTVKADPGQIEQVLVNLAVNARDAMPTGGKLTIETANVPVEAPTGRQYDPPMPAGDYVTLTVADNGCGMDQETQNLIFEPFFTTKDEGKGTGLGLATVYGIVKQSGGFIWVQSQPGCGASFKIYLPRLREEQKPGHIRAASHERFLVTGTETILLVEDESAVRDLARGVLEPAGYTVLDAPRSEEAIKILTARQGRIDLLLTDVVMPDAGGRELARAVRNVDPNIKVVFMSGYAENAIVHRGILEPGAVLLEKPFTPNVLLRKVREVLDKNQKLGTQN